MTDQHPNDNTRWRVESDSPSVAYFDTETDATQFIKHLELVKYKLYRTTDTLIEFKN